jgi:hypothetical protein
MVRPTTPYALAGTGLLLSLVVLLFGPLPTPTLNYLVGGASLAVAVTSVASLIVAGSSPGERGPEF